MQHTRRLLLPRDALCLCFQRRCATRLVNDPPLCWGWVHPQRRSFFPSLPPSAILDKRKHAPRSPPSPSSFEAPSPPLPPHSSSSSTFPFQKKVAFTAATPPKPKVQFLEEEDDESAELQRREELDAFLTLLQEDEQPQQQTATTATANSPLLKEPDFDFAKELEREEEYEKLRKGIDLEEEGEEEEEGNGKSGKGSFYNAMMDGVDLSFIEGQTDELSVFIRQTDRENRKLAVDAEWMQTVPEWIDYEIQSDMAFQRLQDEFDERSEKGESITAERVKKLHDDMEQVRKKLEEDFTDKAADRLYMESLARGELLPGIEEDLKFAQSVYGVTADDDDYDEEDDDYDDEDEDDDYEDEDDEDYDDEDDDYDDEDEDDDYEDEEDEGDEDDNEENKRRNSATLKKNI